MYWYNGDVDSIGRHKLYLESRGVNSRNDHRESIKQYDLYSNRYKRIRLYQYDDVIFIRIRSNIEFIFIKFYDLCGHKRNLNSEWIIDLYMESRIINRIDGSSKSKCYDDLYGSRNQ